MTPFHVHLFVFNGMADWTTAFATASIQSARMPSHPGRYRIRTAARSLAPITTMSGMKVIPDMTLDEVHPSQSALLLLPGGAAWESGGNLEALERAHAFLADEVPVAAIGSATLALARVGVLNDRLHTSNDPTYLAASGYTGSRFYCDVPAIADRRLITAASLAPIEFAHEIFKLLDLYSTSTIAAWSALCGQLSAAKFRNLIAQPA